MCIAAYSEPPPMNMLSEVELRKKGEDRAPSVTLKL
jgi:hypothetical protein